MDISYLPRPYLPSKRGQTGSLSAGSWSFSQHQFLAASHLGPLLQLLFPWVAEISAVLKQESENQNENFFTKGLFNKKFSFWFFEIQLTRGIKVEEEDPTDLLPKIGAENMTRRFSRGCQLDL